MAAKRKQATIDMSEECTKRRKNSQKYLDSYKELWPCLMPSKKGVQYVFCTICSNDFSCLHGGKNDCRRHIECKQHKDYAILKRNQKPITQFVTPTTSNPFQQQVTNAEVLMSEFICQSNLPLSTADTMTKLVKRMCPDSKIAGEIRCGRNKATAILHDLAHMTQDQLVDRMRTSPFTISTDGSNDETSKQFPLVVRTVHPETKAVNSELLSILICEGSATGENIFKLIDKELGRKKIPWKNCMALGCDNANVMIGHKKGVYAFVQKEVPHVHLAGCPLHLIHIAARKAAGCLPAVEELLIDIYYFFNKSDKRKSDFKGTQKLYDVDQRKMLKHVCTRWLSISRCLERLLVNWDPLKEFFNEQKRILDEKKKKSCSKPLKTSNDKSSVQSRNGTNVSTSNSVNQKKETLSSQSKEGGKVEFEKTYMEPSYAEKKVESIFSFVRSPTNRLFCLFLRYTLEVFDEILTNLQAEDPRIHMLRRCLSKLIRSLLVRFVKPSAML